MRARGRFITLEGGEGSGKSTLAARLVDHLTRSGRKAIATREPGGAPTAETLRSVILSPREPAFDVRTTLLLFYAARNEHLEKTIRPALEAGVWVICDRFSDSTRAYQSLADGADLLFVEALEAGVVGADQPNLTLLLDAPPEALLARRKPGAGDIFEQRDLAFHREIRQAFLTLAQRYHHRFRVLDAEADADTVFAAAVSAVDALGADMDKQTP